MRLKIILILSFLPFAALKLEAQTLGDKLAEKTLNQIKQLSAAEQQPFERILKHRKTTLRSIRIDTTICDLIFIEESFCETNDSFMLDERYFDDGIPEGLVYPPKQGIPKAVFFNGNKHDALYLYFSSYLPNGIHYGLIDDYYTKENIIKRAESLQIFQEVSYDSTIHWDGNGNFFDTHQQEITSAIENALMHTWKIITVINKKTLEAKISLQYPVKKPAVSCTYIYRIFDW